MSEPSVVEDLLAFHAHCMALRKAIQGNALRLRRLSRRADRELARALDEEERACIAIADRFGALHHKTKAP